MKNITGRLASLALLLFSPSAFSSLIQNGSFEAPALPAGSVQQVTPTGWSWAGSAGFIFATSAGTISASDGLQFVDIGNTSAFAIQQVIAVTEPGDYALTWNDNATAFAQEAPYTLTVSSGAAASRFDANEGIDAIWNSRTLLLSLAPGSYTISFAPADIPGPLPAQDRFIDNVSMVSAVPAPPAFWLLVTALAGLAVRSRALLSG